MKKLLCAFLLFFVAIASVGCAQSEKTKDTDTFFTALNHMLEADSIEINGEGSINTMSSSFQFFLNQRNKLGLAFNIEPTGASPIAFYIKDGKTYLNYMGATSQSVVENIGLKPNEKFSLYNPFLNFTREEREQMFTNIQKSGDDYTFSINTLKLQQLLDEYGSITVEDAVLKTTISNQEIQKLSLQLKGLFSMSSISFPVTVNIQLTISSMNQDVSIPYPNNLEAYGSSSSSTA